MRDESDGIETADWFVEKGKKPRIKLARRILRACMKASTADEVVFVFESCKHKQT